VAGVLYQAGSNCLSDFSDEVEHFNLIGRCFCNYGWFDVKEKERWEAQPDFLAGRRPATSSQPAARTRASPSQDPASWVPYSRRNCCCQEQDCYEVM